MKKTKVHICWDWKDQPSLEKLKTLEQLGIFVYQDPTMEDADSYNYIFSNEKLTPEQLEEFAKKENGFD